MLKSDDTKAEVRSMSHSLRSRVTMFVQALPEDVYAAFVEPELLTKYWLARASGPLALGMAVHWSFLVEGAEVYATATTMEIGRKLAWDWSDGTKVSIEFEALDGGTAVSLVNGGFDGSDREPVEAALNATEGFALVLADLKTLMETGQSAGIVRGKAKLIALRG